ncbi:MAG: hypothetical protein M3Q07_28780 [Pseudobdellovibrionaceae bacterium]|nr:hypothetical protein [Pseudobdellovibrionaceae bacterium]
MGTKPRFGLLQQAFNQKLCNDGFSCSGWQVEKEFAPAFRFFFQNGFNCLLLVWPGYEHKDLLNQNSAILRYVYKQTNPEPPKKMKIIAYCL